MLSPTPPPALCRRGCTVPGEGWSPAETEHSGEAPRRRHGPLWRRARGASPLAATWIGARRPRDDGVATLGRAGGARADALQRGVAVTVGAVPVGSDDHHHHDDT